MPAWLKGAVETLIEGEAGRALTEASSRLTASYRDGKASSLAVATPIDAKAYLAARMPATFAAVSAALDEAFRCCPGFQPRSLLDVGAGPGTASFAAAELLPGIESVTMLDHNAAFLALSRRIGGESPSQAIRTAAIERADIAMLGDARRADLVIAAYAMVELRPDLAARFALSLWQACDGLLLIVEPGTPGGHRNLMEARRALLAAGAFVAAPCPGQGECPLEQPDWCHFSQRLARSRLHIRAKGASAPFEDEKFSYLAVSRQPPDRAGQRILAPPLETKAGLTLKLCTAARLRVEMLPSRDKPRFKAARKLKWGDRLDT